MHLARDWWLRCIAPDLPAASPHGSVAIGIKLPANHALDLLSQDSVPNEALEFLLNVTSSLASLLTSPSYSWLHDSPSWQPFRTANRKYTTLETWGIHTHTNFWGNVGESRWCLPAMHWFWLGPLTKTITSGDRDKNGYVDQHSWHCFRTRRPLMKLNCWIIEKQSSCFCSLKYALLSCTSLDWNDACMEWSEGFQSEFTPEGFQSEFTSDLTHKKDPNNSIQYTLYKL